MIGNWEVNVEFPGEVAGVVITTAAQLQFNGDGTYLIHDSTNRLKPTQIRRQGLLDRGQFTLDGTLLIFISSEDSRMCAAGERGIYTVEDFQEDRYLANLGIGGAPTTQLADECELRSLSFEGAYEFRTR